MNYKRSGKLEQRNMFGFAHIIVAAERIISTADARKIFPKE
jgi:hypothetical protein